MRDLPMTRRSVPLFVVFLLVILAGCRRQDPPAVATSSPPIATTVVDLSSPTTEPTIPEATKPPTAEPSTAGPGYSPEIDWPPQVVAGSPESGAESSLDTLVTVRFDQPMNQQVSADAFSISPSTTGNISWPEPDTLVFTPESTLQRGQDYVVRVAGTATGINGRLMDIPYENMWETAGEFMVTDFLPEDGSQGVQTDAVITVVFDKPVVPLVASGDQASLPQPLTFSPAAEGRGEWTSTSIYRFIPQPALAGATSYTVQVDPDLQNFIGGELQSAPTWQFTTLSPEVVSIVPAHESTGIAPTAAISITFNMPMDHLLTEAAIALNPPADGSLGWTDDSRTIVLEPDPMLALATEYTLMVSESAAAANGQATLERPSTTTFSTVPFPAVSETIPGDGAVAEDWQNGVNIIFASPMDEDTILDRVIIEPAPDDTDYFINQYQEVYDVFVGFPLEPNTDYTVTVPGDAADPYGNTLGDDYVWHFTTPPTPPLASMNLPMGAAQLSNSFPTAVEVVARNISGFDLALQDEGLNIALLFNNYQLADAPPPDEPTRLYSRSLDLALDEVVAEEVLLAEGGILPTGIYSLRLTAPEVDENSLWWQNQNVVLTVADTNIVVKEMFGKVHVWVTDLATGQPASGRNLTLYDDQSVVQGTAVSDGNGFASFDYQPHQDYLQGVAVTSNEPGQAGFGVALSRWNGNVTPWKMDIYSDTGQEQALYTYIYTDRPIYRPGDTVHYKGIVRATNYGRYNLPPVDELELNLGSAFYSDQAFEDSFMVTVDDEGIFTGEYILPEDMNLGTWQFYITGPFWQSTRNFSVAEYRAPEFLVTMTPEPPETLRGQTAAALVEARFFFGAPASGLPVNWSTFDQEWVPDIQADGYSFGDQGGFFYEPGDPFGGFGGGQFGGFLDSGEGITDANGRLTIPIAGNLLDEAAPGSREVTVEATVGGLGEFPVTSQSTTIFHTAEAYVGLATETPILDAGNELKVDLLSVGWDGEPMAQQPVEVVFYQRDWERDRSVAFGTYYTEWTPVDTEISRQAITTDSDGKAAVRFTPETGGSYLAVATLTDSGDRQQTSSMSVWVIDATYSGWRTDPNLRTMDLVPDKDLYQPGDTAQILVQSPFAQPVQAWLTIERGNFIEQQVVTVAAGETLSIPVPSEYAPNVYVTVVAVKPVDTADPDFPYADIRMGITELAVSIEQLMLDVGLSPQQDVVQPGETATFDIAVVDHTGNPVAAELSLALVDLAVLSLKEDNAPLIEEAFYSPQPLRSQTGSGLFVTGEGMEIEIPFAGGGGGGGGGADEALASVAISDEDEGVREEFEDTAYWQAKLQLDSSGSTTVEIPLPDNLTTWRLHSKAVTSETIVGQNSVDIQSTLPLLIRPVTPRFLTVGDQLQLGANINNNTAQDIEATVTLEAAGVALQEDVAQTVTVPANGRVNVGWPVEVLDAPGADLTFRVEGGGFSDGSKPTVRSTEDGLLPIRRFNGRDFVATAGELDEAGRRVEALLLPDGVDPSQGQVTVKLQPSLAAAIIDSFAVFNQDIDPETECASALADRLLHNTATEKAIRDLGLDQPEMREDLAELNAFDAERLPQLATPEGGWSWCYGETSDPWISAYALLALSQARDLGYAVDQSVMDEAIFYVERQLEPVERLTDAPDANRQAFLLYVLAGAGSSVSGDADALFAEHRALMDPYAKALLALAYEYSGAAGEHQRALLTDLNNSAIRSATGVHWEDAEQDYLNLSSDVRGTAIAIEALSLLEPDSSLIPSAVRWLMVARTADTWPTTHESAWSVLALSDWMAASGELEADYAYKLDVNQQPRSDGRFDSSNLTASEVVEVAVRDLQLEDTNHFDFQRGEGNGRLYYTLQLDSAISVEAIDPTSRGFTVSRQYFDAACDPETETCLPLDEIASGQRVRVALTLVVDDDRLYVVVEDPLPAGAEAIDPNLLTSASGTGGSIVPTDASNASGYWGWWYFDHIQYGDEKVSFTSQFLPAGTYQYTYFLDAILPGTYQVMPATARETYFPEVFGRSEGKVFTITD